MMQKRAEAEKASAARRSNDQKKKAKEVAERQRKIAEDSTSALKAMNAAKDKGVKREDAELQLTQYSSFFEVMI